MDNYIQVGGINPATRPTLCDFFLEQFPSFTNWSSLNHKKYISNSPSDFWSLFNTFDCQWINISTPFEPVCDGPTGMSLKYICTTVQDTVQATYKVEHCAISIRRLLFLCFLRISFYLDSLLKVQFSSCIALHVHKHTSVPNTHNSFYWLPEP